MAANPPTREGVRAHADSIIAKAVADGRLTPDGEAAKAAALTPTFSEGTRALDPNTDKPIITAPPAFAEGEKRALPGEPNPAIEAPAARPAAVAPAAAESAAPAVAPTQAAAGAAAAEAAATAAEEYAEFNFRDPDLDIDIPIRVAKKFEETVKRGYGRRTDIDRTRSYLKNAEPELREMIEDGRMQKLLPLLRHALQNEEYGKLVTSAYQRSTQGLPLVEQAAIEAARAGAAAALATPAAPVEPAFVDPFVDPRLTTLEQRLEAQERATAEWNAARERESQTAAQRQAQTQRNIGLMQAAHQDLARAYPGVFRPELGDKDPAWTQAYQYAERSGYLNNYDLRAAIVFGGQGWRSLEAERIAATASPAATALGQMDAQLVDAATREAAAAARTVSGGAVAQAQPAAIPPKPVPTYAPGTAPMGPNGKPLDIKPREVFMAEILDWETKYGRLKQA
jgi:hypothetical protein